MQKEVFEQAYSRFKRAWNEASYLYTNRSGKERVSLKVLQDKQGKAAKSLGETFSQLEESVCAACGRCCSKAAMNSGFYSHLERQALISKSVDLEDYIVESWPEEEKEKEPLFRCLFLSPNGCNVPEAHRSVTCLTYVCYDRLGPALAEHGLDKQVMEKSEMMKQSGRKAANELHQIRYKKIDRSFGEG